MEDCSISLVLPKTGHDKAARDATPAPVLSIWKLDYEKGINFRRMSWSTRPIRLARIGTFDISEGGNFSTSSFYCSSGSLHNFELELSEGTYEVNFWQEHRTDSACEYITAQGLRIEC